MGARLRFVDSTLRAKRVVRQPRGAGTLIQNCHVDRPPAMPKTMRVPARRHPCMTQLLRAARMMRHTSPACLQRLARTTTTAEDDHHSGSRATIHCRARGFETVNRFLVCECVRGTKEIVGLNLYAQDEVAKPLARVPHSGVRRLTRMRSTGLWIRNFVVRHNRHYCAGVTATANTVCQRRELNDTTLWLWL